MVMGGGGGGYEAVETQRKGKSDDLLIVFAGDCAPTVGARDSCDAQRKRGVASRPSFSVG